MTDAPAPPVTLTAEEARVLGCLMEKAVTTPDAYPLSLNALVNACNQHTNREPVVSYTEETVERALEGLRAKGLGRRVKATGQRVVKHRHVVEDALRLDAAECAVLGVLLLRGAQTSGELKGRTERWHRFRSLDDVEEVLGRLARRGLTAALPRRPGQKEPRWACPLVEEAGAPAAAGGPAPAPAPGPPPSPEADGERRRAPQPVAAHSIEVRNPADGTLVRSVAVTEPGEIAQKLARARAAQPRWAARDVAERVEAVRGFARLLDAEAEECAGTTTCETGKPIRQSRAEIRAVAERIAWYVEHVPRIVAPRTVTAGPSFEERITYEPVGVVAHVSAWNYPYFVGCNALVPALLAGNAVLYKPSEHATLTGLRLVDLLHRAGVPVDVVQAVVGGGATGAELVASEVDLVSLTGSYATGRSVLVATAGRMVRVQLELGGKDPAYVCDDVDVEAAARSVAEGAFYNCGQSCSAIERVYVHETVRDGFVAALVAAAERLRVGDPTDDATDVGPLARAEQVGVIEAQLADALARGGRVLTGGRRIDRPGNWFEPTVVVDVDERAELMRAESFGPVVGVAAVRNDEEAIRRMGDTEFGLGAAVFTRDRARAERILARLDVGNAYWNTADRSCVRLPWAGRRHSGTGVSMSDAGVRTFVREKAWHLFPG
ncbi:MAG: hypothetical protein KatS3mg009_2731 [Acidimicrobiia bacterium]|nr:MAG: hypothetical protein KatS3mg009_2731 [Acidimicrobiia bacterium]